MDSGGDDGLGPVWSTGEIGGCGDFSALHFEKEDWVRTLAFGGVGVCRIVIDAQVIDEREETDEVLAAAVPSFADFFFGDVVTAVGHAAADAL